MSSKQKKAISLIGITGAVYLTFRYLLPLAVPFLTGWMIARITWPFARKLQKTTKIPVIYGTIAGILIIGLGTVGIVWIIGGKFTGQMQYLVSNFPLYIENLINILKNFCTQVENHFHFSSGCMMEQIELFAKSASERTVSYAVSHSIPLLKWISEFFVVITVAVAAAIMMIQERDRIKTWRNESVYRREIAAVTKKFGESVDAYLKTELTIMGLTMLICMAGLTLIGNQYGIVIGIVIGAVDVLPLFGSGTIFLPWIAWTALNGNWTLTVELSVIYLICYLVREWLEARILGDYIGISGLESLISMYIGFKLFGIAGLFLGPMGWILIKEIDKTYNMS